jgi:hypothetical protein
LGALFSLSCQRVASRTVGRGGRRWQVVCGQLRALVVVGVGLVGVFGQEEALAQLWNGLRDFRGVLSASGLVEGVGSATRGAGGASGRIGGAGTVSGGAGDRGGVDVSGGGSGGVVEGGWRRLFAAEEGT